MGIPTLMDTAPTTCRLCGGPAESLELAAGKRILFYARCPGCGFIGLDPSCFLSIEEEKARYRMHRNSPSDPGYAGYLEEFIDYALPPFLPPGARILDFGSGPTPALSQALKKAGFECDSFDPFFNPDFSWQCRSYAAILLHEVAEHLRDPKRTLLDLVPRLDPSGIIAIRTQFLPAKNEAFSSWWYRMDTTHVGFFSPLSIIKLFEGERCRCIKCNWKDSIIVTRT